MGLVPKFVWCRSKYSTQNTPQVHNKFAFVVLSKFGKFSSSQRANFAIFANIIDTNLENGIITMFVMVCVCVTETPVGVGRLQY